MRFALLLAPTLFATTLLAQTPAPAAPALQCPVPTAANTPADQAYISGDSVKAESLFAAQISSAPTAQNYAGLVHAQLSLNKITEALASAQKASAALPSSGDAQALVGEALARGGQIPEASAAYIKALTSDRCSSRAHLGFARLNDLVGRHLTAAREYSFAHRLAPNDPDVSASFLAILPADQRAAAYKGFVGTHPALPPAQLAALSAQADILDQHLTCAPATPYADASITLARILQNGRSTRSWGFKINANAASLPLVELDTSVHGIVLNPDDAAKAKVHPLSGAATPNAPYLAVADQIVIGDLTFKNCPVTVAPIAALDARNSLIGTDFFADHLIHIDYVALTLKLTPLPPPPPKSPPLFDQFVAPGEEDYSPVYIAGPLVIVPTLINKKGPYLFALDTGMTLSVISPAVTARELSLAPDATINLKGSSGTFVKVLPRDGGGDTDLADVHTLDGTLLKVSRPGKLPVYRFGTTEIPDNNAVSFNIDGVSHAYGVEISGLLSFGIINYFSVDINYRDALARLAFDTNRRYHVRESNLAQ